MGEERDVFGTGLEDTGMSDVQNSRAVLAALKGLQDKIRSLEVSKSYTSYSGIPLRSLLIY